MTYYINEIELDEVFVSNRRSADAWNLFQSAAENIPHIEKVGQGPTNFTIDLTFRDNDTVDKHAMYTSVDAEMRSCVKILFRSTDKYLYGNQQRLWLAQSDITLTERAGKRLEAVLSAIIDPYQVHTCDFDLASWNSSNMTTSLDTAHIGKYSFKTYIASPSASTTYSTSYDPDVMRDFSDDVYIGFWIKPSTSDYSSIKWQLYTDLNHLSEWTLPAVDANKWNWCEFEIANPDNTGISGPADLTSVDQLKLRITIDASPPSSISLNIDDIRVA